MSTTTNASPTASRYHELVVACPLRPLRSEEAYNRATTMMRSLLELDRTIDEEDYLDVLSDLIRAYEDVHYPMPTLTQAHVLRALLEDHGVTEAQLASGTGIAEGDIAAILANHRGIGENHRVAFGRFFDVPPGRFVVA